MFSSVGRYSRRRRGDRRDTQSRTPRVAGGARFETFRFIRKQHSVYNSAGMESRDRRSSTRYFLASAHAEVLEPTASQSVLGRATVLGRAGCYVDAFGPFAAGSVVRVGVFDGPYSFQTSAKVAYFDPSRGMGLAFADMPNDQIAILSAWLGELNGEVQMPEAAPD
jgi:hypothetical protein